MLDDLLNRFRRGDRLALARLLSLADRGESLADLLERLPPAQGPSRVVAITGSAGVGKSTLIGKLIDLFRQHQKTVAVLACDPQSPLSGGALLGDRFRMTTRAEDDGVFIRSLATAGGQGGVATHVEAMVRILEAFPFDMIVIETVGAGQGDTVVGDLADVVVLLLQPHTGDDLQWEKAGVLEVADIVGIHKADLPGAEAVESQVRNALHLAAVHPAAILRLGSKTGEGLEELVRLIESLPLRRSQRSRGGKELLRLAHELLSARFLQAIQHPDPRLARLLQDWEQQTFSATGAAEALLSLLAFSSADFSPS